MVNPNVVFTMPLKLSNTSWYMHPYILSLCNQRNTPVQLARISNHDQIFLLVSTTVFLPLTTQLTQILQGFLYFVQNIQVSIYISHAQIHIMWQNFRTKVTTIYT